jgi:hypothetical protein
MGDKQQLVELKTQIINELTPLMERTSVDPEQKFAILMLASRSNGDDTSLKVAYEAAKDIRDDNTKLEALMELLEEVDFHLRPVEDEPQSIEEPDNENPQ